MEICRSALGNSLLSVSAAAATASAVHINSCKQFSLLQTHTHMHTHTDADTTFAWKAKHYWRLVVVHHQVRRCGEETEDAYATVRAAATIWNNICVIRETLRAVILLSCLCNFIITILRSHAVNSLLVRSSLNRVRHTHRRARRCGTVALSPLSLSVFAEKFSVLHYYIIVGVRLCFALLFRRFISFPLSLQVGYIRGTCASESGTDYGCVSYLRTEEFPSHLVLLRFFRSSSVCCWQTNPYKMSCRHRVFFRPVCSRRRRMFTVGGDRMLPHRQSWCVPFLLHAFRLYAHLQRVCVCRLFAVHSSICIGLLRCRASTISLLLALFTRTAHYYSGWFFASQYACVSVCVREEEGGGVLWAVCVNLVCSRKI